MQDAVAVEEEENEDEALELEEKEEKRRKLFVVNLPWGFSAANIEKLFVGCDAFKDVVVTASRCVLLFLYRFFFFFF